MKLRPKLPIALAIAFGIAVFTTPNALGRDTIKVGGTGAFSEVYAAYYFGRDLGFWDEQDLDFKFVVLRGSAIMIPQLASKQVDISSVTPELLITAANKGRPFPVRLVFNNFRRNHWRFGTRSDSSVESLADLKGGALGVGALTWGNLPLMSEILADAGVEWDKDVKIRPVGGMGPNAWRMLAKGSVDALNLPVWDLEKARLAGHSIRYLPIPDKYTRVIANGFATHVDNIRNPDLIVRWGRAYVQSIAACDANRRACLAAFLQANPEQGPAAGAARERWLDQKTVVLEAYSEIKALAPGEGALIGHYPVADVENLVSIMREGEKIASDEISLDLIFTNALIDAINDVDIKAAEAKARAVQ